MANRERRREEEEEEKEAEEFLDEKRVLDGQERFWSQESEVRLRVLAAEERVKMSPQGQDWNPRYLLEAKAELERRREAELEEEDEEEEEEKRKRRKEESRERIKQGKEEVKERLRRSQGRGAVRPELKNPETESAKVLLPLLKMPFNPLLKMPSKATYPQYVSPVSLFRRRPRQRVQPREGGKYWRPGMNELSGESSKNDN